MARIRLVCDLRNKAYSDSWANDFRKSFERMGGQVVDQLGFDSGEALSMLASSVLASRPDGVMIIRERSP